MPRMVPASKPTLAKWVRAAARIFALVGPAPGRLPVRGIATTLTARERSRRTPACGDQLAQPQQNDSAHKPAREHADRTDRSSTGEVEAAAQRAVQPVARHPGRRQPIEISQKPAADR